MFQQGDRINPKENLGQERGKWKVREFANKHGLKPVAGNYFQVRICNGILF